MAAAFASAIDKACFAALEAAAADVVVALLAAVALLDDFATSACSLLTCSCRSAICASMDLRSVQPAVTIAKVKIRALGSVSLHSPCQKLIDPNASIAHSRIAIQRAFSVLKEKKCASVWAQLLSKKTLVANGHCTPFSICHRKWQRIDERPRSRSGRRVGLARLTRRYRASTWMYERLDQTENVQPASITREAEMKAFALSFAPFFASIAH
jgi:hypothetical protein